MRIQNMALKGQTVQLGTNNYQVDENGFIDAEESVAKRFLAVPGWTCPDVENLSASGEGLPGSIDDTNNWIIPTLEKENKELKLINGTQAKELEKLKVDLQLNLVQFTKEVEENRVLADKVNELQSLIDDIRKANTDAANQVLNLQSENEDLKKTILELQKLAALPPASENSEQKDETGKNESAKIDNKKNKK